MVPSPDQYLLLRTEKYRQEFADRFGAILLACSLTTVVFGLVARSSEHVGTRHPEVKSASRQAIPAVGL